MQKGGQFHRLLSQQDDLLSTRKKLQVVIKQRIVRSAFLRPTGTCCCHFPTELIGLAQIGLAGHLRQNKLS